MQILISITWLQPWTLKIFQHLAGSNHRVLMDSFSFSYAPGYHCLIRKSTYRLIFLFIYSISTRLCKHLMFRLNENNQNNILISWALKTFIVTVDKIVCKPNLLLVILVFPATSGDILSLLVARSITTVYLYHNFPSEFPSILKYRECRENT